MVVVELAEWEGGKVRNDGERVGTEVQFRLHHHKLVKHGGTQRLETCTASVGVVL
jgi:hypothetical protein